MKNRKLERKVCDDTDAGFALLFQQYRSYAYAIIWEILSGTGTAQDAEECLSDVFLQVFRHFDAIREESVKSYIGTVARNKAIDYSRKLNASGKHLSSEQEALLRLPSDEDIAQDIEKTEYNRFLYDKIQQLGEPDSTILILKYFYDKQSKDIAKQVQLSPISVRVRLNRALKKLRRILSEEDRQGKWGGTP